MKLDCVWDNRERFVDMLVSGDHVAVNTFYTKEECRKVAYKESKQHPGGPPWGRTKYEVVDYITVARRWRNSVRDVESDVQANITWDRYPLWADIQVRLRAERRVKREERKKYEKGSEQLREDYNRGIRVQGSGYGDLVTALKMAAEGSLPEQKCTKKRTASQRRHGNS